MQRVAQLEKYFNMQRVAHDLLIWYTLNKCKHNISHSFETALYCVAELVITEWNHWICVCVCV